MKLRTKKYLNYLESEAVKFYFKNPEHNSLSDLSEMFRINKVRISNGISKELRRRKENSLAGRLIRL
tara:strand:- start:369 stop:569 length:201 start_codon:yes stop_codon:yes gene_type:complete